LCAFRGYNPEMNKKFNLRIPGPLLIRLNSYSQQTGLTLAEIIRRAIDQYLDAMTANKEPQ
jgi:predicted DNA-binding protein